MDELAQPFLCSHHLTILSRGATQPALRWLLAVWVEYSLLMCSHCALQNTLATMPANLWKSLIASYYLVQTGFMFTCYFLALLQIWVFFFNFNFLLLFNYAAERKKEVCRYFMQFKNTFWLNNPTSGNISERTQNTNSKEHKHPMFIAELFPITQIWKQI